MCRLLRITGNSLYPFCREGDFVLVSKISLYLRPIKSGDIVVFKRPPFGILIKRVDHVLPGGEEVFVLGTDALSMDSRRFGPIKVQELQGRVVFHVKKPGS